MKISANYTFNNQTINYKGKSNIFRPFFLRELKKDSFEKTTTSTQSNKVSSQTSEKEIRAIYNEVFDKVLEYTPILKKLNIQKPQLTFNENLDAWAAYDFPSNTIELSTTLKENMYAFEAYNEKEDLSYATVAFKETLDEFLPKLKEQYGKIETTILNKEEKELILKGILIHELRHWTQEHILASTKGCQAPYKRKLELIKPIITAHEELVEIAKKEKLGRKNINAYKARLANARKKYCYILNYSPKEVLDENFKLSASIDLSDNEYWSIKEHFLPACLRYKNSDDNEYNSNPTEIDAFYYQAQFMFKEAMSKNMLGKIRSNVLQAILTKSVSKGFSSLESLEEHGYPSLFNG